MHNRSVCQGGFSNKFLSSSSWAYAGFANAFVRGVWGQAPPGEFLKMVHFVRFEGYFQPLSW